LADFVVQFSVFDIALYNGKLEASFPECVKRLSGNLIRVELANLVTAWFSALQKHRIRLHQAYGAQWDNLIMADNGPGTQNELITHSELFIVKLGIYSVVQPLLAGIQFELREVQGVKNRFFTTNPFPLIYRVCVCVCVCVFVFVLPKRRLWHFSR